MRKKCLANIPFVPCEPHGWDWGHPRETEIVKELKTAQHVGLEYGKF